MAIKDSNYLNNRYLQKLSKKTQMIRNGDHPIFTDRMSHTKMVVDTCKEIVSFHGLNNVDLKRLIVSAYFHDIGHTPFGHAGEDTINELFLTNDNSHYSESRPGLFKHNVNSIRLLAQDYKFEEEDFVLMDSILKHSSVFPKRYNLLVFNDENIIKMNYIFRKILFTKSAFFQKFIDEFKNIECPSVGPLIEKRKACRICNHKKFCLLSAEFISNPNIALSTYLAYRYPLTIEGTILYWADEISCFCSDLLDMFLFFITYERDINSLISLSSIKETLTLLKSTIDSTFVEKLVLLIDITTKKDYSYELKKHLLKETASSIRTILISSLDVSKISLDKLISINVSDKGFCEPRFSLSKDSFFVFSSIKKSIYTDIHNFSFIKKTNSAGSEIIKKIVRYFMNHFDIFIDTYCKISGESQFSCSNLFAESSYNLIGFRKNPENRLDDNYLYKFKKTVFSKIKKINTREFSKFSLFSTISNDHNSMNALCNLFKREICYFVASLSEKQLLSILVKHEINTKLKLPNLPKKY